MEKKELEKRIIDVLKSCYDPEIPVDIYELGLIYEIKINPSPTLPAREGEPTHEAGAEAEVLPAANNLGWAVEIIMTLTSPNCPVAESLPMDVENKVKTLEEIKSAKVTITFDPPWDRSMMSEEAKLELGFM